MHEELHNILVFLRLSFHSIKKNTHSMFWNRTLLQSMSPIIQNYIKNSELVVLFIHNQFDGIENFDASKVENFILQEPKNELTNFYWLTSIWALPAATIAAGVCFNDIFRVFEIMKSVSDSFAKSELWISFWKKKMHTRSNNADKKKRKATRKWLFTSFNFFFTLTRQ